MFFQKMSVPVQSTVTISSFLGLDRRARGELGSFREMENLTSDGYPTLTVRPRRGLAGQVESPGGIAAKDALIWVDGHTLYIGGVATELVLTEGSKQLIGMGNWLIVWPDKKYINTGDLSQHGSLENRVQTQGQVTLSLCGAKGAALGDYLVSEEPPADPAGGCLWLDTTGEIPVLRQYGESGWSIREDTYVKIAAGGIGVGFTAGDGVVIEGCREESINGSHVLEAAEDGSLVVPGMIASQVTQTEEMTVRRSVPEMDFVIESGNRLWGCKYGVVDGKAVNEIYASKLGDFKNWNCYARRSTDSYVATRGSDGPFTGAADYLGSPLFFKEDCVERVYPSAAGAHQIVTVRCPGVRKGSGRSLQTVEGVLYYHGCGGVYAFDGSMPQRVSQALGEDEYHGAVAGGADGKYYLSVLDTENQPQLLVYDVRQGLWHREDDLRAVGFAVNGGVLYAMTGAGDILALKGGGTVQEEPVVWRAETGELGLDSSEGKYLVRLSLRLRPEEGSTVRAAVSYDEGQTWQEQGGVTGSGWLRDCVLHVRPRRCRRLRLRLYGAGGCRVYSLTAVYEKGSDGP